jgi:hypothetical protein
VTVQQQGEEVIVAIGAASGGFAEQPVERRLAVILQRAPGEPAFVRAEGPAGTRPIEVRYDAERQSLRVDFTQPAAEATQLLVRFAA